MNEFFDFVKRIIRELIAMMVVVALILFISGNLEYILGWLWGCLGNIAYFYLLAFKVRQIAFLKPSEGAKKLKRGLIVRLAMVTFIVCVAILVPGIHVLATAIGLVSLTIVFYIDHFVQVAKSTYCK